MDIESDSLALEFEGDLRVAIALCEALDAAGVDFRVPRPDTAHSENPPKTD